MNFVSHDFTILPKWFYNNFMVFNPDKSSFLLLGFDDELQTNLVCGNETLKNSKQKKVLGVTINNKLYFATHLSNITKNANIKFNELTRVQKHITIDQKKRKKRKAYILFIIKLHFIHCPFIFCTKHSIGRISSIHEGSLHLMQ